MLEHVPEIVDSNLEEALLGAVMIRPDIVPAVLSDSKIKPASFALEHNRAIFEIILKLHEQGTPPTTELVASSINGNVPRDYVFKLSSYTSAPGNEIHYAKRLVELAQWRRRRDSCLKQLDAIQRRDMHAYARAKSLSDTDTVKESSYRNPTDLAKDFSDFLSSSKVETFKLPFPKLNDRLAGGLRRQQVTILGGWTSHGKSIVIDQILETIARQGHSAHLYINEMGHEERIARYVARKTGYPFPKILGNTLSNGQNEKVTSVVADFPFSITPCAGWSIDELVFDIKSRPHDVIGIDILHQFDYDSEIELARISRFLNRVAKQAHCHVIVTVHLNEGRATDSMRPRPVTRDIRGSGMIKNDADNVLMIFREQDPATGNPLKPSSLYTCKVRNGALGSQLLMFDEQHLRFNLPPSNEVIYDYT